MSIKTGASSFVFPPFHNVRILAETRCSVFAMGPEGPEKLLATDLNGEIRFRTGPEEVDALVQVPKGSHWSLELFPRKDVDEADPVPVEMPDDARPPETLEDKLRRFVGEMVAHRYGKDSEQMETLEDALDFGEDDDEGIPLSGYEVSEMAPVEPVSVGDASEATPEAGKVPGEESAAAESVETPGDSGNEST